MKKKISSYQKLKMRIKHLILINEHLKSDLFIFKDALTYYCPPPKIERDENMNFINFSQSFVVAATKKLHEHEKQELSRWVALNLDKDSVLELLKLKEDIQNGKNKKNES